MNDTQPPKKKRRNVVKCSESMHQGLNGFQIESIDRVALQPLKSWVYPVWRDIEDSMVTEHQKRGFTSISSIPHTHRHFCTITV